MSQCALEDSRSGNKHPALWKAEEAVIGDSETTSVTSSSVMRGWQAVKKWWLEAIKMTLHWGGNSDV